MKKAKSILAMILSVLLVLSLFAGCGSKDEVYPSRNINVVVWSGAGGAVDNIARGLVPLLSEELGVSMPINNMAGGSGSIGAEYVLGQEHDGYTLLFGSEAIATWQLLDVVDYTCPETFIPICFTNLLLPCIMVPADSPFNTVDELFDYILAHPGELNFGTGTESGSSSTYYTMLQKVFGLDCVPIRSSSGGETVTAVMGGQVDWGIETVNSCIEGHNSGLLKILGIASSEAVSFLPEATPMGTMDPSLDWGAFFGVYMPADTPQDVVDTLVAACQKCLETEEWKTYCENLYMLPLGITGDEAIAYHDAWQSDIAYLFYEQGVATIDPASIGIEPPAA